MGLLYGENCMILTSTVFDWSTRVTDGQTDGIAIAYARLQHTLSRAKTTVNANKGAQNNLQECIILTDSIYDRQCNHHCWLSVQCQHGLSDQSDAQITVQQAWLLCTHISTCPLLSRNHRCNFHNLQAPRSFTRTFQGLEIWQKNPVLLRDFQEVWETCLKLMVNGNGECGHYL